MEATGERKRVAIACQGGGSHTAFTAGVLKRLLGREELARLRDRRPERHLGRRGVRAARLVGLAAAPRAARASCSTRSGRTTRRPRRTSRRSTLDARGGRAADVVATAGRQPVRQPVRRRRAGRVQADAGGQRRLRRAARPATRARCCSIGAVDVLSGRLQGLQQPPRPHHGGDDPRLGGDPHPVPRGAASTAAPTGTACSRRTRRCASSSTRSPDEIWVIQINPRRRTPSRARRSRSPTGATSCRATSRCTRSCASSRRSTSCSRRARSPGRPLPARSSCASSSCRATRCPASLGTASKLNRDPAFIAGLIAHGEERADEFLGRAGLRARLDAPGPRGGHAGLLRRGRRARLRARRSRARLVPRPRRHRRFLREHLADEVAIDLTRKQVAGDGRHVVGAVAPARVGRADARRDRGHVPRRADHVPDAGGRGLRRRAAPGYAPRVRTRRASSATRTPGSAGSPPASPPIPPGARAR